MSLGIPTVSADLLVAAFPAAVRRKPELPPRATAAPMPPPSRRTCFRVSGCSIQCLGVSLTMSSPSSSEKRSRVDTNGCRIEGGRASRRPSGGSDGLGVEVRHAPACGSLAGPPFRQLLRLGNTALERERAPRRQRAADLDIRLV